MNNIDIRYYKGTSYEIGYAMGLDEKNILREKIEKIRSIAEQVYKVDLSQIKTNSLLWYDKLPEQYKEEALGLSDGSGCSLDLIMQWIFFDNFIDSGCTSFIINDIVNTWVGRNNDYIAPKMWKNVSIISKHNLIPVMLFGIGGELFSGTGYNKEKIWMHYNWLPIWDTPKQEAYPPYIFLRMALETCRNIDDVENLLNQIHRCGGMNLFVIDGKDNTYAVYECTCDDYCKREQEQSYIAGANHYNIITVPNDFVFDFTDSIKRQTIVEDILKCGCDTTYSIDNMINVLSGVEKDNGLSGTVYANISCPATNDIYYACDGFPAASKSKWEKLNWTW